MATATATKTKTNAAVPALTPAEQAAVDARRAERIRLRRERQKAARSKAIRLWLYRVLCWLELLPRRIGEATTGFFTCAIVLLLFAAAVFAAMGLLEMAMSFWASFIPGW